MCIYKYCNIVTHLLGFDILDKNTFNKVLNKFNICKSIVVVFSLVFMFV